MRMITNESSIVPLLTEDWRRSRWVARKRRNSVSLLGWLPMLMGVRNCPYSMLADHKDQGVSTIRHLRNQDFTTITIKMHG